jgi:predicted permease
MHHLKLALRTLVKTPFVSAVAILSLALGIGANAAIFSLFDQMLLQPLPVPEPERLVNFGQPGPKPGSTSCNQAGDCEQIFSLPMLRDLERETSAFTGIAGHRSFPANLALQGETLNGGGMLVSGSYFSVLGLRPALGRLIGTADDQVPDAHDVAVLSYRFWENRLGGDPDVVGRTVVVNGRTMTIVGVAPDGFEGTTLGARPDVFVPLIMRPAVTPGWEGLDNRRSYWVYLFARLQPGTTLEQGRADVNAAFRPIIQEVELPLQEGISESMRERFATKEVTVAEGSRGQSSLHEEARVPLLLLFAVTGVVLLIACANIANLLLARGASRSAEMAVRGALGAGRRRMLTQLLTESVLLALLGGVAGLAVAGGTLRLLFAILPAEMTRSLQLELNPSVMLFAGVLSIATGLFFGLYPAVHATRPDLITALRNAAGQPSGARSAARFRWTLVTGQIALSMVLLVAAGLFIKSLRNVSRVDLGLGTENVVAFHLSPELNGYAPEESEEIFRRLEEELAAIPGVTDVSAALVPILSGNNWGNDVSVEGFTREPGVNTNSRYNAVGPGYFRTLQIPIVAGREFTAADDGNATKVAVVNEAFTRKFGLDGADAVGKLMATGGTDDLDMQIIGVVRDAKYADVKQEIQPLYFQPWRQVEGTGALTFYVRAGSAPEPIAAAIPRLVERLDSDLPVERLTTLDMQARESVYLDRMISMLSAAFALLATLLAAVGLYGVLAYTVAQRTREIGLRMALGAGSERVRRMVLRQILGMLVVGGTIGIAAALFVGRAAQSLLFGMQGHDPWVVTLTAALLGAVALAAGYVPALRASRVDPMQALRWE